LAGNHIEGINQYEIADLWRQRSLHLMMMAHTGNASSLRWSELGRRKGVEEVVVTWAYSVALVCLLLFVSKRFVNEIIKWLDYQSNISKRLIIKGLDNQTQVYKYVCLIIKSLDTQVQKLHNQINQYPRKSLISYLGVVRVNENTELLLIMNRQNEI
jgi:hypothetical protein